MGAFLFERFAEFSRYFSGITEEILEEYLSDVFPEKALGKYEAFFGEYEPYVQFKDSVIK